MAAFTIENLTFRYPLKETAALKNISFTVEYGEFVTVCGKSGCGKSTLLRNLKTVLAPHGKREGEIWFYGRKLSEVDMREQSKRIGYVLQNPDNQIVTDKVWHELAFGLESLGYDTKSIRLRVAEMASFFGIQSWFMKNVNELSGGQKQLLNLASIMAMQPDILILDEPTSQLDPISAADFLETVKKINREIGTTVIMTEHRLEEVFPVSDRVMVLDQGELILNDAPEKVGEDLHRMEHVMFKAMPSPMQIYEEVKARWDRDCPITVRDGRNWMTSIFEGSEIRYPAVKARPWGKKEAASWGKDETAPAAGAEDRKEPTVELKEVWFQYDKKEPFVIKDLSIRIPKGEWYCIVGGNGAGKTTALTLISGINRPQRGESADTRQRSLTICGKGTVPRTHWRTSAEPAIPVRGENSGTGPFGNSGSGAHLQGGQKGKGPGNGGTGGNPGSPGHAPIRHIRRGAAEGRSGKGSPA